MSFRIDRPGTIDKEYLKNRNYWTNRDVYISIGSRFVLDHFVFRLTSVGGVSLIPQHAFAIKVGNELLGFPNVGLGLVNIGLLNESFEVGVQTPVTGFIPDPYIHFVVPKSDTVKTLAGGFGGYGRISLFGVHTQLSFSDFYETKFVTDNVRDSTYVDFISLSGLFILDLVEFPIKELVYVLCRGGFSGYQVSHRSLLRDGNIVQRTVNRSLESLEESQSSFLGPVLRIDVVSRVREGSGTAATTLPSIELFAQINAYKNNKTVMAGGGLNIRKVGIDITYKRALDPVDWVPDSELFVSFNYSFNQVR